ncbi:right-handed parallel beta-helix repeat-containing protein [Candidatus Acetothermia bacterium]|nr:right-handed parallel beta-helix repeat-containing protein [Candidatus Acetothermia bacterium]
MGRIVFVWVLLALNLAGIVVPALASHSDPISYVDASLPPDEDTNGDRHFKTISAALAFPPPKPYEKIVVAPGVYTGDLTITIEGLTIVSERGPDQTKIIGQVKILANNVHFEGFEVVAKDKPAALAIAANGAQIVKNRAREAEIGIDVQTHSQKIELQANEMLYNSVAGMRISGSRDVSVSGNAMRGNFGAGIEVEVSFGVALVSNRILLNQGAGLRMARSQPAEIVQNTISGNGDAGLLLDDVSLARVAKNELTSNGTGIFLKNVSSVEIVQNQVKLQKRSGIILQDSKNARVEGNAIEQNQSSDSAGISLYGDTSSSEIVGNIIDSNSVGIKFSEYESRRPSNNHIAQNKISDSDEAGILIAASDGQNQLETNEIWSSSGVGLFIASAGHEVITKNSIHDNGSHGVQLQKSDKNTFSGNQIAVNGKSGIYLEESIGNTFTENTVERNTHAGFYFEDASSTELSKNIIRGNIQEGLRFRQGEALRLTNNEISGNDREGLKLEQVMNVTAAGNAIRANSGGGVSLTKVADVDLQGNTIEQNLQFGVMASGVSNLNARRNFWGVAEGPAGGFSGGGNAVVGLDPTQIVPWLPASPEEVNFASVAGKLIRDSGGDRVQFNAHDTVGIDLELHELRQAGQDQVKAPALITLARYLNVPGDVQTMSNGISYYYVLIRGFDSGVADFTIYYDTAELSTRGITENQLRVFSYTNGKWNPLPSWPQPDLNRIVAEARLEQLEGVIALAPETASLTMAGVWPLPMKFPTRDPIALEPEDSEQNETTHIAEETKSLDHTTDTRVNETASEHEAARFRSIRLAQPPKPESHETVLAAQIVPTASATPFKSGPDSWGIVMLFLTISLCWTALRLYRSSIRKK